MDDLRDDDLLPLLQRIWRSPGWAGSVVIERSPERGVEVFWRASAQKDDPDDHTPDARGVTIREALEIAAEQADGTATTERRPEDG